MDSTELAGIMREFLMDAGPIYIVLGVIVALVLGYWYGRQQGDAGRVRELEAELENQRSKSMAYRSQVDRHFQSSAELFTKMAYSYRDMYEHVVKGYDQLGAGPQNRALPSTAAKLLELTEEDKQSAISGKATPAPSTPPTAKPIPTQSATPAAKPSAPSGATVQSSRPAASSAMRPASSAKPTPSSPGTIPGADSVVKSPDQPDRIRIRPNPMDTDKKS